MLSFRTVFQILKPYVTGFAGRECEKGDFFGILSNKQANRALRKAVKHTYTQHNPEIPRRAPAGLMDGVLPKQNTY